MKRIGFPAVSRYLLLPALAFALLLTSRVVNAQSGTPVKAPSDVAVKAGRVLDVRTGKYAANQMIWIEDGRIKEVGDASTESGKLPKGTRVIDLSQDTVLPGLIDCHTHLTMSPWTLGAAGLRMSIPRQALLGARNARATLEAGFTTVRNLAAYGYSDIALRDAINAGDVPGPRILASGPALSITGGMATRISWRHSLKQPPMAWRTAKTR